MLNYDTGTPPGRSGTAVTEYVATAATEPLFELAEGIIWDDRAELVRWVDLWKGRVMAGHLARGRLTDVTTVQFDQTTSAVALADDGGMLVAAARGLATISPSGVISVGPDLLGERANVRLNDGIVDPQGRFLIGTLSLVGETGTEVLLRVSPDGTVETLRESIRLSNGLAFSPDGSTLFHVDTFAGTVSRHSYGPGPFDRDEEWVTVLSELPANPDGITVDADGNLWVAQWGGSSVRHHAPTGELLDIVRVNAGQVSCPAFVGPGLDTLAITTGQEGLETITDETGAIFLASVGTTGLPGYRWAGSTTTPYWAPSGSDDGAPSGADNQAPSDAGKDN